MNTLELKIKWFAKLKKYADNLYNHEKKENNFRAEVQKRKMAFAIDKVGFGYVTLLVSKNPYDIRNAVIISMLHELEPRFFKKVLMSSPSAVNLRNYYNEFIVPRDLARGIENQPV